MRANHRARRFAKDLRAAARTGIQAGFDQFLNHFFVAHFVEMGKVIKLHHRESFQMKLRIVALERESRSVK